MSEYLPAEPLQQALRRRFGDGQYEVLAFMAGVSARTICRFFAADRVQVRLADQLAVKVLGEHPRSIWGSAWDVEPTVLTAPAAHGTLTSYVHYGCRCAPCRETVSRYRHEKRRERLGFRA